MTATHTTGPVTLTIDADTLREAWLALRDREVGLHADIGHADGVIRGIAERQLARVEQAAAAFLAALGEAR